MPRVVHCEVQVVSWRERRIKSEISVNADVDSVWDALTDYECLADFVPNLVSSKRIPCPHPDGLVASRENLSTHIIYFLEEIVLADRLELPIIFKENLTKNLMQASTTMLCYGKLIIKFYSAPFVNYVQLIKSYLNYNMKKVDPSAENPFLHRRRITSTWILDTEASDHISGNLSLMTNVTKSKTLPMVTLANGHQTPAAAVGQTSPMPSFPLESVYILFDGDCQVCDPVSISELKLHQFVSVLNRGHAQVVIVFSLVIVSGVEYIYNVKIRYKSETVIVPNLAISKILSRENNKVRILQEGCKGLLYMVLHARVILDLCEKIEEEISFEQVEGDFDSFQGKWILEQLGSHHTLLKYSVESKMHKNSFLSEAIMEEVIYEDLPSNLCAIRDYIETLETENAQKTQEYVTYGEAEITPDKDLSADSISPDEENSDSVNSDSHRQRPKVPGLQRDIEILRAELLAFISEHGQEGFMPMRKQLRKHGRVDIEKAITRMGGFRRIAFLMNLSLAYKHRKPKGYWDNLENLQDEISRFQRSWGMDPSYMPSRKSFERAGRYDIARALEKWGGLHEVSRLLSLKVRHPNRQQSFGKEKKFDVAPSDVNGEEKTPRAYVSQDAHKWLTKLKELDINWVE
nr:Polyketide cyclase [Ipomoea batatas]